MKNSLMDYENKLIKLLDLQVIENDDNYELLKNGEKVGTILKQEEINNNQLFYTTKLDIDNLHFYKKRNTNDKEYVYRFYINKDNDRIMLEMDISSTPSILIYSNLTNLITFKLNISELILEYPTITKWGMVVENLKVKLSTKTSKDQYLGTYYNYQAITTNRFNNSKKYKLTAIKGDDGLIIIENFNKEDCISNTDGTIRNIVLDDQHGQDLFNRFRAMVNSLLKTNDFMKIFLEERGIVDDVFSCFYNDLLAKDRYRIVRVINDEALFGIKLSSDEELKISGAVIYDLKEIHEFGVISGYGDYSGSYEWDNDYIYRISENKKIESVFDIKDRVEIMDKDICQELYNNYKNQKVLRK